jgi:formylglycine-generating enzyme required for sulfatase activity
MVLVPRPGVFWMGNGSVRHRRRIDRNFAISAREVTVAEFRRSHIITGRHNDVLGPTVDCPVNGLAWIEAAEYCNWLSKEEGIPKDQWCYVKTETSIRPAEGCLKLTGYRLPTQAEWEYTCRAGSNTSWSHGDGEDLLAKYAWYISNSGSKTHPAGLLRPNGLGLFDMHGNVWEWCQDKFGNLKQGKGEDIIEDIGDIEDKVDNDIRRVLRGGSCEDYAIVVETNVSVGNRQFEVSYDNVIGFRPARTFR